MTDKITDKITDLAAHPLGRKRDHNAAVQLKERMRQQISATVRRRYAAMRVPPEHATKVMQLLSLDETMALVVLNQQKLLDLLNDRTDKQFKVDVRQQLRDRKQARQKIAGYLLALGCKE